jgi:hypothetical protein
LRLQHNPSVLLLSNSEPEFICNNCVSGEDYLAR